MSLKNFLVEWLVSRLSRRKHFLHRFFLHNRDQLVQDAYQYPSVLNNGYLHIERTWSLCDSLGLARQQGVVIDAGAAGGIISLMLAEKFPHATIYAFEPIRSTFEELKRNTAGRKNIRIFPCGLGSSAQKKTIQLASRITSSSLFGFNKEIKDEFLSQSIAAAGTEEIEINTLDNLLMSSEDVLLIKLDVQGFELEILKGAEKTLQRTSVIVTEMQNHDLYVGAPQYSDIDKFLIQKGFVLYDIIPSIRSNNKLYEWDAIYLHHRLTKKDNN